MATFPLRFSNPETREHLRLVADELGTSMNRLAEEMIERELAMLSLGLEVELETTLVRLRRFSRPDVERSLAEWAATEGQPDPIAARATITLEVETQVRLRRIAAERGVSMAELIREAIDTTIDQHAPRPRSLGAGASGIADTARRTADERPEPRPWR